MIEDRTERRAHREPAPADRVACPIGEPSLADAIYDCLLHRAHRLTLKGPTMRDPEVRWKKDGK